MNRADLLDAAKRTVCGDRAATHGNLENNFACVADLWSSYIGHVRLSATDVAAMMILFKTARIRANPTHIDSWVDVAGYAACGAEVAE